MDRLTLSSSTDFNGCINSSASLPSSPYLHHESNTTAIHRINDIGIKVLHNLSVEEHNRRLLHEHHISSFLPPSCSKRMTLDVKIFSGRPSLFFTWSRGITLKEWMRQKQQANRSHHSHSRNEDMKVRLSIAMAICKTLSDFHDGGVVYNRLSPENIVLDESGNYTITFIDLSGSLIYHDEVSVHGKGVVNVNATPAELMKKHDMQALGGVLNTLFRQNVGNQKGVFDDVLSRTFEDVLWNDDSEDMRRKRGKQQTNVEEELPYYLGCLISNLMGAVTGVDDDPSTSLSLYESAKDVHADLRHLADKCSRDRTSSNTCPSADSSGKLILPNVFYGRQVQLSMLIQMVQSMKVESRPMMTTVSGVPGTG